MPKTCPKCQRELSESEFNWKVKNVKLAVHCKDCSRKYIKEHYKNNLGYYLTKAHKRNHEQDITCHNYIGSYLSAHPCVDCGEKDILVLEFDHRDRKEKEIDICQTVRHGYSIDRIKKEILKCEVRCANCHRRKTAKENKNWKLKYMHL